MGIMRMTEKWNEKWPKNANCEWPYYFHTQNDQNTLGICGTAGTKILGLICP